MPSLRFSLAFATLLLLSLPAALAHANNGGIHGYSGSPLVNGGPTCTNCHTGGQAPSVVLSGPTVVNGDEANTYTLTISGGQATACGLDVSAEDGDLVATEAGTQWWNGEITHAGPRAADGSGTCTYTFDWVSPVAAGMVTLYAAGNSVDGDQTTAGDAAATDSLLVTVNGALPGMLPPVADANGPHGAVVGALVAFDGSASFDPDGNVVQWDWDFGDGSLGAGPMPTHAYATSGTYTVTLTVTDDQGRIDSDTTTAAIVDQPGALRAVRLLASGSLDRPTWVTAPPGDPRLFIVQQGDRNDPVGRILIFKDGALLPTPFLTLSVGAQGDLGSDAGLRGMAFAPDYASSGLFYLLFSRVGDIATVVARFRVDPNDPDRADPTSREDVLAVVPSEVFGYHFGSHLEFGPDGLLYVAMGDSGLMPQLARDDGTLWGKMLRIDVSGGPGSGYTVPPTNPFVGPGNPLDEIWAKGFRNPYRFSIDQVTGDLYIGDVGQANEEEIDIEPGTSFGGLDYGWDDKEGLSCLSGSPVCTDGSLTDPEVTYPHTAGLCAVVAGSHYRGLIPGFAGRFFYTDFCTGRTWSFRWDPAAGVVDHREHTAELTPNVGTITNPSAIGRGGYGELFIVDYTDGELFRIESTLPDGDGDTVPDDVDNCDTLPNRSQLDRDGDGFGNPCDCDFDNDGFCSIADFTLFLPDFQTTVDSGLGTDMDEDGAVGIPDFNLFLPGFVSGTPGP